MVKFTIGPVEAQASTKTGARAAAIEEAASTLNKLADCPLPISGPPHSEIVAIAIVPVDRYSWRVQYVLPDRVFSHDYRRELCEVRKFACEFAAEYDLGRHTTSTQIEDRVAWLEKHLALDEQRAQVAKARLELLIRQCHAYHALKGQRVAGQPLPLSIVQIHAILNSDPALSGELLELSKSIRREYRL